MTKFASSVRTTWEANKEAFRCSANLPVQDILAMPTLQLTIRPNRHASGAGTATYMVLPLLHSKPLTRYAVDKTPNAMQRRAIGAHQ